MRLAPLALALMLTAVPTPIRAQQPASDQWLGKRVVQRHNNFPLRINGQAVLRSGLEIHIYRVQKTDGDQLWLVGEDDGLERVGALPINLSGLKALWPTWRTASARTRRTVSFMRSRQRSIPTARSITSPSTTGTRSSTSCRMTPRVILGGRNSGLVRRNGTRRSETSLWPSRSTRRTPTAIAFELAPGSPSTITTRP